MSVDRGMGLGPWLVFWLVDMRVYAQGLGIVKGKAFTEGGFLGMGQIFSDLGPWALVCWASDLGQGAWTSSRPINTTGNPEIHQKGK